MKKIQRYIPRKTPVSASDLNAMAAELVRLGKLTVAPPLVLVSDGSGVHIRLQPRREIELVQVALITKVIKVWAPVELGEVKC